MKMNLAYHQLSGKNKAKLTSLSAHFAARSRWFTRVARSVSLDFIKGIAKIPEYCGTAPYYAPRKVYIHKTDDEVILSFSNVKAQKKDWIARVTVSPGHNALLRIEMFSSPRYDVDMEKTVLKPGHVVFCVVLDTHETGAVLLPDGGHIFSNGVVEGVMESGLIMNNFE